MKESTIISTRLTLTKEERPISKSWGMWWNYFGRIERQQGFVRLLFGNWSGYNSHQQRITHIDIGYKTLPDNYYGVVKFSDNTTMNVWIEKLTRKDIIRRKLYRNPTYSSLIHKLLKKSDNYYDVAAESKLEKVLP